MAVSILDAYTFQQSIPSTIATPSAGSDRWLYVIHFGQDGSDASDPTSMTWGGQSLTKIAGGTDPSSLDVSCSIWGLNEAGIAAASGTTFSTGGLTGNDRNWIAHFTIQDAEQGAAATVHTSSESTTVVDQGSYCDITLSSFARVADGLTVSAGCFDGGGTLSGSNTVNPSALEDTADGTFISGGFGYELSVSETVDCVVAHNFSSVRDGEAFVINIGPATGGGSVSDVNYSASNRGILRGIARGLN